MRVGTPSWMAPERLTHDEVTPAGDVWSWGAVMAFAALGHPVVGGSTPEVAAHRILRGEADITGVPAWLAPWVSAALSVVPAGRPDVLRLVAAMGGDVTAPAPPPDGAPAGPGAVAAVIAVAGVPPGATGPLAPTAPGAAGPGAAGPGEPLGPTAPGLPPTRVAPGQGVPATLPAGRSRARDAGARGGPARPDGVVPPGTPAGVDRRVVRWGSALVVVAVAAIVGATVPLLVAVIVTAVVMVAAVALRLGRERLPDGARPVPPTWSVALAGPVVLGVGLAQVVGPVGAVGALLAIIVVFVILGGDIG
jgi:hypothetical protein